MHTGIGYGWLAIGLLILAFVGQVAKLGQDVLLLLGEALVFDDFQPLLHAHQESQIIESVFESPG